MTYQIRGSQIPPQTLHMHTDTSFISVPVDKNISGGYHYLSAQSKNRTPPLTDPLHSMYQYTWNLPQLRMSWKVLWNQNWDNYLLTVN